MTFKNADSGENMGVEFFFMIMGQTLGGGYNFSKLDDPSGDYELNGNHQRLTLYNRISLPEKYIKYFITDFIFVNICLCDKLDHTFDKSNPDVISKERYFFFYR